MTENDAVSLEESADHGFIVTVAGSELADLFDDFLVEQRDYPCTFSFLPNGTAFYLGKILSHAEVEQIIEAFRLWVTDGSAAPSPA